MSIINSSICETLENVTEYYHKILTNNEEAVNWLKEKKIYDVEAIRVFRLGYSNFSLSTLIPANDSKIAKSIRDSYVESGIYTETRSEYFRGCLVFPIINQANRVENIYGVKISENLKKGVEKERKLNFATSVFFNHSALNSKRLILCQNPVDALTFWINGHKNVSCLLGTDRLSPDLSKVLIESQVEDVVLAFKASQITKEMLMQAGIVCYQANLGQYNSINELIVADQQPKLALVSLLENVEFIGGGQKTEPERLNEYDFEIKGSDIFFNFTDRQYRIRGLDHNKSFDCLRINIQLNFGDFFYNDTFDLLHAKNRTYFIRNCAVETIIAEKVIKKDLGKILMKLEDLQNERLNGVKESETITMSENERKQATDYLKDKNLIENITRDFEKAGLLAGEHDNALTAYLCMTSRLLKEPLPLIIQSASSAGKTSLMNASLSFMPEEDVNHFTALSEQCLYYLNKDMRHKIIAVSEDNGLKGLEYPVKILESEGELKIASTGKESNNSRFKTETYILKGPIQFTFTTTDGELDEELANRSLILSVSEDQKQTATIHDVIRFSHTLAGLLQAEVKNEIIKKHQNAQRLLDKDIQVVNPFAEQLKFPANKTRHRRDFKKYLTLIKVIAFLHQHQRELKTVKSGGVTIKYIEVTPQDIELANKLSKHIFSECFNDLSGQIKSIYNIISDLAVKIAKEKGLSTEEIKLNKAEILSHVACLGSQLSEYLKRLVDMELLTVSRDKHSRTLRYTAVQQTLYQEQLGLTPVKHLKLCGTASNPAIKMANPALIRVKSGLTKPCTVTHENPAIQQNSQSNNKLMCQK